MKKLLMALLLSSWCGPGLAQTAEELVSGRGGSNPNRSASNIIPTGGSVWTFALLPE